ncbi:FAD dependent oxidoreductase [Plectosphaerella cucumerina]|uniref:FAD dependent oxidoreductase n=1 Tax=Plectosphaerella cucumerina TaxID=40658 RepID=A0A8K0TIQ5_9PEZI|nr:FAD dependent oxidoreductase [Plectosphaerella cucumerina]
MPPNKDDPIIIIGAGVFGLSTALELKTRGYTSITVLDRFLPPVPDGSSVDISRIIRVEYADPLYASMAREAREGWLGPYARHYHESGFVMLFDAASGSDYAAKSKAVGAATGQKLVEFTDGDALLKAYPHARVRFDGLGGIGNAGGGWADAESAIRQLSGECSAAGVSFITGARGTVKSLRYSGRRITGVTVSEGPPLPASTVILSTGAWTNSLIDVRHASTASGQPVGFIQLTPAEAATVRDMPVLINLSTGVFCFPPTPDTNILKVARHGFGFATSVKYDHAADLISAPRTASSNARSSYLPDDADEALREGLRQLLPDFAERPWMNRRLCWYSDTPEGDFIIDRHPDAEGLFLATGGAGHAFKFLPVLGRYVADCFEDKAPAEVRRQWRFRATTESTEGFKRGDGSRGGPPLRVLSAQEQAKL